MSEEKEPGKEKKDKTMLFVGIGAGVLLLSCCCLGGVSGGVWYFFFRGGSAETKIIGKWGIDTDTGKKSTGKDIFGDALAAAVYIEFKADKTVVDTTPMTPILAGTWKTLSSTDNSISVELNQAGKMAKLDIKIVDIDHLKITPLDTKKEFAFKRLK